MDTHPKPKKLKFPITAQISTAKIIGANIDLLTEILLRMPPKPVTRFKLVSKQWKTLINTFQFRRQHTLIQATTKKTTPLGLYFYNCLTKSQVIENHSMSSDIKLPSLSSFNSLPWRRKGMSVKVLQSQSGLLLLTLNLQDPTRVRRQPMVFNPVLRQIHYLPPITGRLDRKEYILCYNLVHDPHVSEHFTVIALKSLTPYSIFSNYYNQTLVEVHRYSLETKKWSLGFEFELPPRVNIEGGVSWDGGVHWIGEKSSIHYDLKNNQMTTNKMPRCPQGYSEWPKIRYFGEWGGHLHLIRVKSVTSKKFNVLEFDKENQKWFSKYHVYLPTIVKVFPEIGLLLDNKIAHSLNGFVFSILAVVRGKREEESELIMSIPGKVISFNFFNKTMKIIQVYDRNFFSRDPFSNSVCCFPFIPNLVPIQKIDN